MSFDDNPYEVSKAGYRDEERFNGEEMADLMYREPDRGETAQPKKEKAQEIFCGSTGTL